MTQIPLLKSCFKCGAVLPIVEFYRHPMMGDGHLGKCKACTKRDVREGRADRRQQYARYERARWNTPERRSAALRHQAAMRERWPEKYAARVAVGNALRDGRLHRQPCEICGAKAQAHHEDYARPLDVRWLCRLHHLAAHGKTMVAHLLDAPASQ